MKKSVVLFSSLLLTFLFQQCNQSEELTPSEKTKITFSFSTPSAINGRKKTDISESTTLIVSIETATGVSVLLHHSLKLLNFGDGLITDPVELLPGEYVITDFMLVDEPDVQFVTPQKGSVLSSLVKHPLPYGFKVARNKVDNLQMEVVSVDEQSPEDFGYASFHINAVRPLLISVFAQGNTPKLTTAKAYLIKNADTLNVFSLGAKVNVIPFKRDPQETYKLVIQKEGYTLFNKTFIYNDLIAELNGHPLNAYLEPALTTTLHVIPLIDGSRNDRGYYSFVLAVSSDASFMVDWGDGTIESLLFEGDENTSYTIVEHSYSPGSYHMTMTGDIGLIVDYIGASFEGTSLKINFDNLPALKMVNFYGTNGVYDVLDIRKNKKIEYIIFGGKTILLPNESNLKGVGIYNYDLAPSLDYLINYTYANAVAKSVFNGYFHFDDTPDSGTPIGNPSVESLWKLQQLRDVYNWQVSPL